MATDSVERRAAKALVVAALLGAAVPALAAGGAAPFAFKPDTGNVASLQKGARNYMNYCAGCHSLKYLRYNRIGKDLGLTDEQVSRNLMFAGGKLGDHVLTAMPGASKDPTQPSESEKWFGRAPPDLSLTARERGPDWVYSYLLTFYLDPSKPSGVNNCVLPGASMPHVLGDLQGWQKAERTPDGRCVEEHHKPKLELVQPGSLKPGEYREFAGDLVNFMVYAAEPGRNQRMALGVPVLGFIVIFGILCWLLKREYWKDVH